MIDRVLALSLRHRGLVLAACLLLAWLGVRAVNQTPMDAIPDLSENQVIVFSDWPGHGPPEVEDHVTQPLTDQLRGIKDVRTVRSSSDVNFSMIHVIFDEQVDVPTARLRVEEHLRR
ncbi:MAG TPA: efflux RND transporter permease subunit, partial [Pirellulaceae bacterium]|nr:efflux RND transporter permease subunit [Pirellulaceae bacterium]